MSQETSKIYVDLDSLLDTRQGTVLKFDVPDEIAAEYLASEEYNFRTKDEFSIIEKEAYKAEFEKRDINTLKLSTVSYILYLLAKKIHNFEARSAFLNEKKLPELVVNIYPYKLEGEQLELLKDMIFVRLKLEVFITVINVPHSEITPFYLKSRDFISCFMYDFAKWIDVSGESLKEIPLNNVIMYFPAIHEGEDDDEVKKIVSKLGFKDVFAYTEFLLSTVVNVSFLPSLFYSNIKVAELYMDKYEKELAKVDLSKYETLKPEEMEQFLKEKVHGYSSSEIPVP